MNTQLKEVCQSLFSSSGKVLKFRYDRLDENIKTQILEVTSNCEGSLTERVYWIMNDLADYPKRCLHCGNKITKGFYSHKEGYRPDLCSTKCQFSYKPMFEKATQTKRQKYDLDGIVNFIELARKIHGDLYDYSKITPDNYHSKFPIRCQAHGIFYMYRSNHLRGSICPTCAKPQRVSTRIQNFGSFMSKEILEKCEATRLERYGSKTWNNPELAKATCLEKFGVDNAAKAEAIQQKMRQTNMERRGVEFPMQSPEVKQVWSNNFFERYGGANTFEVKEFRDKIEATCLARYGVSFAIQAAEVREKSLATIRERYGVDNVSQNYEIMRRQQASAFRLKDIELPSGRIVQLQGYEPQVLSYLFEQAEYDEEDFDFDHVPPIKYRYLNKNRVYHPDFYVPKDNLIIEVKSLWTLNKGLEQNYLKHQAVLDAGYNMRWCIWCDNRRELLDLGPR